MAHARSAVRHKLDKLTTANFELVHYVDPMGRPHALEAGAIPTITWPDGRWCYPANVYMLELARSGKSRRNRGGTLHTYATELSHLIWFCFNNGTDFIDLTDNQFRLFVNGLIAERSPRAPLAPVREPKTVRAIAHVCLDFLATVGRLYGLSAFIGPTGNIRAERVASRGRGNRGASTRQMSATTWSHHALPTPSPERTRQPISGATISAMREAAVSLNSDAYLKKRRLLLLRLLEITGGRRAEIAELSVSSVEAASTASRPMLELITVKGGPHRAGRTRFVPISQHDAQLLQEFAKFYRRPLVTKIRGKGNDDGCLLVSATTGQGLRANTITQEIALLRSTANIETQACAHMFRHRYITKMFVALLEQYQAQNIDDFRKVLYSEEELLHKVREWTGHVSLSSLERYLHLAVDEFTASSKIVDAAQAQLALGSFQTTLAELRHEIRDPSCAEGVATALGNLIENMLREFGAGMGSISKR